MPGHVPPARDDRWRRFGLAAACLGPLIFALLWGGFWVVSGSASYAVWAAGAETLAIAVSGTLVARAAWAPRPTGRRTLNVILASWAVLPALLAALLAVAFGAPVGWAAALGAGAGVVAGGVYARQRRDVTAMQTVFPLAVDTLADAELLRAATQQPSDDTAAPAANKAMQRLNHARALTFLATRDDDHDRLVEALPLLRAVLQDQALDPAVALLAAADLVNAESMLAERGRDDGRYGEAVELYARLVRENPGIPAGQATLHENRAGYQQYLARAASEDFNTAELAGDHAGAARALERLRTLHRSVEQELKAALELTDGRAGVRLQYLSSLGSHLCMSFDLLGEDRTDEGVDLCRAALASRAGLTREQRPLNELELAFCLLTRWDQRGDVGDLDEAEALLRRVVRQGNPVEARARALLLEVAVRRDQPGK